MHYDDLKRINRQLKEQLDESEGSIRLLSELYLDSDDDEYVRNCHDFLIDTAKREYFSSDISLVVAYHLMDIGKRNYKDGAFWTAIGCTPQEQTKIGRFFLRVIERYNLDLIETSRRYVDNILFHAFIPEEYIDQYFNFVAKFFNIYLGRDIPEDLDEKIGAISKLVTGEASENYPGFKSMLLIKTTRMILETPAYYTRFTSKLIHRFANDYDDFDKVRLGTYEDRFKQWLEWEYIDKFKKTSLRINSSPFIYYDTDKRSLHLIVPERVVAASDDCVSIITSDGDILAEKRVYKSRQFDSLISERIVFSLSWDPLSDYRVVIGNKTIFTNTDKKHILLNSKGVSEKKLSLGYNLAIIPSDVSINLDNRELHSAPGFRIVGFRADKGTELCIGDYRYIIEIEATENIQILSDFIDIGCKDQDGNRYALFSRPPKIRVSVPDLKGDRFRLTVTNNGLPFSLQSASELRQCIYAHSEGKDVILDLSKTILGNRNGLFHIRSNGRDFFKFVVVDSFSYKFEKEVYHHSCESFLTYTVSGKQKTVPFSSSEGSVEFSETVGGMNLLFEIPVPSYRFSFDKKKWILFNERQFFIKEIMDNCPLYVNCPDVTIPKLYVDYAKDRGIKLEFDGEYLQCSTHPIILTNNLMEQYGPDYPRLTLCCDERIIFEVLLHSDYNYSEGLLTVSNRCPGTETILKVDATGEEFVMKGDSEQIPVSLGRISVIERYDDGFDISDRRIMTIDNSSSMVTDGDFV